MYKDSRDYETIGVGRNISASGPGLRPDEIELMLENDLNDCERDAGVYLWYYGLPDTRKNVVLNLLFNMGAHRFAGFHKFHQAMAEHDWKAAAHELDDSLWQEQVDPVLGDGKGRADELIAQLLTGVARP